MPAKRKAWWHYLRGPRGHRGLPGPPGPAGTYTQSWENDTPTRIEFAKLVERVADLERKLGGSQK